jgi:4-hydroxybenzoate polyprenyltransferase
MSSSVLSPPPTGFARLKLFWALSRTPHGVLDMATPAFAALVYLGKFPSLGTTLMGVITAFAGYTAVYALNDLVDYRNDKTKFASGGFGEAGTDLDAVFVRHPMAQGYLTYTEGLIWALAWSGLALVGAYWLNPVCIIIFLAGCLLEAIYCRLWRVTHYRALVNGAVKTCGPVAAVFAVDPSPDPAVLLWIFISLFLWEIGGQNVPNDWADIEADRRFQARTIPIRFGPRHAIRIILGSLAGAISTSLTVFALSPLDMGRIGLILALAIGVALLMIPAFHLYLTQTPQKAMALFNRASYYPVSLLALALIYIVV